MSFTKGVVVSVALLLAMSSAQAIFKFSRPTIKISDLPVYQCGMPNTKEDWCPCFHDYTQHYCAALGGGDICNTDATVRSLLEKEIQDIGIGTLCMSMPVGDLTEPQCEQVIHYYLDEKNCPIT